MTEADTLIGRPILSRGTFALALAVAALAGFVMRDAWHDTLRIALVDEEVSYVLLAPLVILWLAWVRRKGLEQCPLWGGWVGVLMLLAGLCTYWYGYYSDPVVWRTGAVISLVGAFVSCTGCGLALKWTPVLAAAVFLIPADPTGRYHVAAPLEQVTARISQDMCDLLGIAVSRSGNLLLVNGVGVSVSEACNGARMILALFLVCYVVAFSTPLRASVRLLFLIAAPLVAILFNVMRLVPTAWMFGHRSIEAAERFHDISGWIMTLAAFVALMAFSRLLRWASDSAILRITPADPLASPN